MNAKTAYLTVSQAQLYFDGILDTDAWDDASTPDKNKALIQASSDIDKLAYKDEKFNYQQEHEFPRDFVNILIDPNQYDTDNIPMVIKYAVCEQALALLDGWDVTKEIDNLSVISVGYGDVKNNISRTNVPIHLKMGLCPKAAQFILPLIRDNRSLVLLRV